MKKICVIKKKAFTLIEIILALIVASIIASYTIQTIQKNRFFTDIVKMQNKIKYIVNDGIINSLGYPKGTGGDCSSDFAFTNLTTKRLAECLFWDSEDLQLNSTVPEKLIGIDLMRDYGQCTIETKVDVANSHQFFVYVDCSNLEITSKQLSLVENSIKFVFEKDLSAIHIITNDDSNGLNSSSGGNSDDGQIRAQFEL